MKVRFDADRTIYAVAQMDDAEETVEFSDCPLIFRQQADAERYMRYDVGAPVVIYEMRPIWRSKGRLEFTAIGAAADAGEIDARPVTVNGGGAPRDPVA